MAGGLRQLVPQGGNANMVSVSVLFFSDVLQVAIRHFGERELSQEQLNALVASLAEFERVCQECVPCGKPPFAEEDEDDYDQ
jgi:hypothetical protein